MAYLTVENVSKRFGGLKALDSCSFSVAPNRTTCLVGPNGAGKTSVFNVITGFIRADEGTIRFRERDITGLPRHEIVQRGIARTFQNLRLFDDMTAADNVVVCLGDETANGPLTAMLRPFHTNAVLRRKTEAAVAILEGVGLGHKAFASTASLSYGQKKLLCIARVLATGAELLLLDEPTSGLSAGALETMVEMVRKLQASGKTLLVVEHNTRIVQKIADDVLFLHQGRLIATGTPAEIIENDELGRIYFGGTV